MVNPVYLEGKLVEAPAGANDPRYHLPTNAIDDTLTSGLFEEITQEIKAYVANYFHTRHHDTHADPSAASDELKTILDTVAPAGAWRTLLQQRDSKGRMLVIRAALWGLLGSAWETGELVGYSGINNTPAAEQASEAYSQRRAAYIAYIKNSGYAHTQAAVITALTARMDAGLAGWVVGGHPGERHAALSMIVERAAALAGQLGVQVAEFRLLRTGEGGLDLRAMENVEVAAVALGGERVRMVVAPGLVKWGNAGGEQWTQNLVLVKAKVVLECAEVM